MLNIKYDIKSIPESSTHIDPQERTELYTLFNKYESLFDVNLGTCHGKTYYIKLKPDAYIKSRSNKNLIDSRLLMS